MSIARIRARAPPVRRLYTRDAIPAVERKERIMARRIPAREVLRLRSSNLSLNAIAAALHASKASVSDVLRAAAEHDVAWEEAELMSAGEVYARLFPERERPGPVYPDPDWDAVHAELAKVGVTLRLLRGEYREECAARGEAAMSYDRFCKRYRQFTVSRNVVSRVGRKAGRNMEVDWSGPTMSLVDPATGVVSKVYLFVACLPFSRYSYVEPALDMKQDTWLRCHVHAFEFLGGATPCIVPDNLKTGVAAHPREGEVVLNAAYEDLAARYGSAVMPARVRRPRDKASAENEVWCAATYVIGALRNEVFTDMASLRAAVAAKVAEHNAGPFSKREGSRAECFAAEEAPLLRLLPPTRFEVCEWVYGRKVQANCHVSYKRNYYSVSHLLVGREVDLRVTESTVEVFLAGERVATHPLSRQVAQPLLHPGVRHARRRLVQRLGRGEDTQVGGQGRTVLQEGRGPRIRILHLRRAGVQRMPRRAEARAQVRRREARARLRAGARDRAEVPQVQGHRAHIEIGAGPAPGRRLRGRRRRLPEGRRLLRG